jgi:V8-like Glu-specific endopeptidase
MCFKNKKIDLVDTNLQMPPFNMVLHLGVKFRDNDHEFYSTASFISSNILLTARHCVTYPGDTIQFIELCLSSPGKDKWIKLTANDFKIYEYEKKSEPHIREQEEDIALIKILNKTKLQALYKKPFSLPDSTFLSVKKLYEIHLTGFPCSKFSINKYSHDTLVDRSATDSIQKATNQDLLGFTLCFCAGDSGGPIWIKSNNQFYIIAIAESPNFRSYQGIDKNKNIGVLISNQTVNWIKSIFDN